MAAASSARRFAMRYLFKFPCETVPLLWVHWRRIVYDRKSIYASDTPTAMMKASSETVVFVNETLHLRTNGFSDLKECKTTFILQNFFLQDRAGGNANGVFARTLLR